MDENMKKRLEATKERFASIEAELEKEDVASDLTKFTKLSKERATLEEPTKLYEEYLKHEKEIQESFELETLGDPEMAELAKEERKQAIARNEELEVQLKTLLVPKD
ncbi:MAG TPA: peptide chain release factor 1, partial [Firmicutes bacterium]|nr:peptide chain release factor 1 [Bacillota bacterium]